MHYFAVRQSKFVSKLYARATVSLTLLRTRLTARNYEELLLNNVMSRKIYTAYHKIRYVLSLNWVALPCAVKQSGSKFDLEHNTYKYQDSNCG